MECPNQTDLFLLVPIAMLTKCSPIFFCVPFIHSCVSLFFFFPPSAYYITSLSPPLQPHYKQQSEQLYKAASSGSDLRGSDQ